MVKSSGESDTVLPTARHRCDISSKGDMLPAGAMTGIGPANSQHASAYYNEYNEKFNIILLDNGYLLWIDRSKSVGIPHPFSELIKFQ